MFRYIIKRIAYAIPIALSVSIVCFMLVHIAPGDPIDSIIAPDTPKDVIEQVKKDYGLDKPLPIQYAIWLSRVVQGDLGNSIATRTPHRTNRCSFCLAAMHLRLRSSISGR